MSNRTINVGPVTVSLKYVVSIRELEWFNYSITV